MFSLTKRLSSIKHHSSWQFCNALLLHKSQYCCGYHSNTIHYHNLTQTEIENYLTLGKAHLFGSGETKQDFDAARSNIEKIIQLGGNTNNSLADSVKKQLAEAQHIYGAMHNAGIGVDQNYETAINYYKLAAQNGSGEAQLDLAVYYEKGIEGFLEQDFKQAFKYYELAAVNGQVDAQYNLALMFYHGNDQFQIDQDFSQARKYFELAGNNGDYESLCNLGVIYLNGEGVDQDFEKSISYFEKAAEHDYEKAIFNLGVMYLQGLTNGMRNGVSIQYDKAIQYFERAAEKGYPSAHYNLGYIYYVGGNGVKQDFEKARHYFEKTIENYEERLAQDVEIQPAETQVCLCY